MEGSIFQMAAPITKEAIAYKSHHNPSKKDIKGVGSFFAFLKDELSNISKGQDKKKEIMDPELLQNIQSLIQKLFPELTQKEIQDIAIQKDNVGNLTVQIPKELVDKVNFDISKDLTREITQQNIQSLIQFKKALIETENIKSGKNNSETEKRGDSFYILSDRIKADIERVKTEQKEVKDHIKFDPLHFKILEKEDKKQGTGMDLGYRMWQFEKTVYATNNSNEESSTNFSLKTLQPEKTLERFVQDTLKMIRANAKEMVVKLEPPELGEVKILADIDKGIVNLKVQVEREDVKQMMDSMMGEIKANLEQNGIKSGDIMVWVKGEDMEQREGFSQGYERKKEKGKRHYFEHNPEEKNEISNIGSPYIGPSLNYLKDGLDVWA